MLSVGQKVIIDFRRGFGLFHTAQGNTCTITRALKVRKHDDDWLQIYEWVYLLIWLEEDNPGLKKPMMDSSRIWTEDDFHVIPAIPTGTILSSPMLPDV